ncbi:uncharacterized protein LOC110854896 [Folsomia candida]|uniref:uncharacterized protein LOC110854896 n=1 Tax=Folsomia candida TaxID=158441 RepID=UPI000B9018DA|nr:uncharacterized protein LOC110854896 [Folsomia candida]
MDRLKKQRTPQRSTMTRLINELDAELGKQEPDVSFIYGKMTVLEQVREKVAELDKEILDAILDDEFAEETAYADENNRIMEYIEKHSNIKVRVEMVLANGCASSTPPASTNSYASVHTDTDHKKNYKLPKIQLKKFNGELTEWLGWWAQFKKIHEDDGLHDSDKFQYLIQCIPQGTRARDLVDSYPQSEENYPKVIRALQDRFGKSRLLKQVYVREMLRMVNVNANQKVELSKMYDRLESQLRSLESLGSTSDNAAEFLYPMVESSLPEETLIAWQRSSFYGKDGSTATPPRTELDYLMDFIKQEVEAEEMRKLVKIGFSESKETKKESHGHREKKAAKDVPTAASLSVNSKIPTCAFCGKSNHPSQDCYRARTMNKEQRDQKIKESRACFSCLKQGNISKNCRSHVSCPICNRKHYAIMCPDKRTEGEIRELSQEVQGMTLTPTMINSTDSKLILMKTLHVRVKGFTGEEQVVRLLFDEGSQRSYVKTSLAIKLKCPIVGQLSLQNTLFGGHTMGIKVKNNHRVILKQVGGAFSQEVILINEDKICSGCPAVPTGPWISELASKKIYISDMWSGSSEIDILIGSDLWGKLMTGRMYKLKNGLIAVESVFGWTLSGEVPVQPSKSYAATVIPMMTIDEKSLPNLWNLDTIGIKDTAEKISQEEHDMKVKSLFQQQITRDDHGRYEVKLPWISNDISLPSNRGVAEKMLVSSTQRLKSKGDYNKYDHVFEEWEQERIIERVEENCAEKDHFLPHRPVFKPVSATTPVRPVFDASCKVGKNPSLNQCLEKGPNMLELIPSILLRFREKKIGIISDIRKAFQMVGVASEDLNFQKFLWWKDPINEIIKEYRHTRVVFGLNCSPFILAAVLEHHLSQVEPDFKTVAELLKKSLYVDNCVVSLDTDEEYEEFRQKSITLLAEAKMDLRQWERSNDLNNVTTTVLGMKWDKSEDKLFCQMPKTLEDDLVVTKRSVLSLVSQIFDPLGILSPALLQPKLMLQESWAMDLEWDEPWNQNQVKKFMEWWEELGELGKIQVPRQAFGPHPPDKIQLHIFTDASVQAYAAVVFVRVKSGSKVTVQLLMSKSRVSPLDNKKAKKLTIPRAELLGGLIGSRLGQTIKEALSMEKVECHYWTDSTTVLAWIKRNENYGTFVGNRVREINKLTRPEQWRHVPGIMNPADLPSRGCSPSALLETKWWEGPRWLYEDEKKWPQQNLKYDEDEVAKELKKCEIMMVTTVDPSSPRFSTYLKNIRVAGWIRRFINNARNKKENRSTSIYLIMSEMRAAELDVVRSIQQRHYNIKSPVMGNIQVEIQDDGLWHVKTRLTYKEDSILFRSPILLPNSDPITHQLIMYIHMSNCHAGTQFVLGKLRERYWIPSGRKTVGSRERIDLQYAFQTTGVDLAGPLVMKGGKKLWIVLYTCAVYRGIYLDIVDSLSSEDFLDSLEKFCCLIGRPSNIFSDNGTDFVGAVNLMKKLNWIKLEELLQVKKINWTLNPPSSPWWGGWWERLVRSVKELLRRMLGTAKLTRKELESCMASISYTINNRPLTTLTEDDEALIPLTPAMFMKDLPVAGLPEHDLIVGRTIGESYKKIQNLKRALRERFRKEYLANLVQHRSEKKTPTPEVGDVVLVGQDNKKRFEWPLGRILEVYPGRDGNVRVAKVKTKLGSLLRPLQRLYPLEVPHPKSIEVTQAIKDNAKESTKQEELNEGDHVYKTRSGREIAIPSRYGSWNK